MAKHDHEHTGPGFWATWCSPVGLGIFFITTAIGAAVAVYTILTLVSGIMSLMRPAPNYMYSTSGAYPAEMQTSSGAAGATVGQ